MARNTSAPVQQYRGNSVQVAGYTGPAGELVVDTTKNTVVVQDNVTQGGHPLAKEARVVSGDAYVKVNGGASSTLANDIALTTDLVQVAADLVSTDANNGLSVGSDQKLFAKASDASLIVAPDDKIVYADENQKVAAKLSMAYNQTSGKFDLIGNDDTTVIATVTIPSSTSGIKGVYVVDGKPDASGSAIQGDYHLSVALKGNNGEWSEPLPVTVTTVQGTAGQGSGTITLPDGATSATAIRVMFNGESVEADGTTSATATFDDGSTAAVSWTVAGSTANATVNFTPQIGLIEGTYLQIIWLYQDGTVHDTFVDLSQLIDVYTAGNGIAISSNEISVRLTSNLQFTGGAVDINLANLSANLISTDANNALKQGADSKLAVKVVSGNAGNVLTTGTDAGALLTHTDLASEVSTIVEESLASGADSLACKMISAGEGNQIQCHEGMLYVSSDYGTMD